MEQLKKLEEVMQPDNRNTHYVIINTEVGKEKNLDFEDWYRDIALIELSNGIPEEIKSQFNIAKNLAIYTWFCYPFHQISEMKAFSTVEYALRGKYNCHVKFGEKSNINFRQLLEKAVKEGILMDSGFTHLNKEPGQKDNGWVKEMPDLMCEFRNDLAHGSNTLNDSSWLHLRICADLINQLF